MSPLYKNSVRKMETWIYFFHAVTQCNKEGHLNIKGKSQKAEGSRVRSVSLNKYMLLSPILLCIFFINRH